LKHTFLVIDLNNLFWRSVSVSLQDQLTIQGVQIYNYVIQDVLERIKELRNRFCYDEAKIYFLIDNTYSKINFRKTLDEGYKHPREFKTIPKYLFSTLNFFIEILKIYSNNFYTLWEDNLEADDLTYPLLKSLDLNEQNRALFVSADMDWARNITKYSSWFNYSKIYNAELFKAKYKFSPYSKKIQFYKAIKGDNSDAIPNAIPYLPETVLLHILENYKDVEDLYKRIDSDKEISNKWYKRFLEERERVEKNYQLADFIALNKPIDEIIFQCKENIKGLRIWFKELHIPFEPRMIEVKKDKNILFNKRRLPRV
jgi:5'-3' exonuclease